MGNPRVEKMNPEFKKGLIMCHKAAVAMLEAALHTEKHRGYDPTVRELDTDLNEINALIARKFKKYEV